MSKLLSELQEMADDMEQDFHIKPSGIEHNEAYEKIINGYLGDAINPSYYKNMQCETIDYMKAISTMQEYQGHLRLTALKYISRVGKKDKSSQEIGKAIWYLEKLKESLLEEEAFFEEGETE